MVENPIHLIIWKFANDFFINHIVYYMEFVQENKIMIGVAIVAIIGLYFLHTFHVKQIIHDELKQMARHNKRIQMARVQNMQNTKNNDNVINFKQDMDSYIEPDNIEYENDENKENDENEENDETQEQLMKRKKEKRLTSQTIGLRDIGLINE